MLQTTTGLRPVVSDHNRGQDHMQRILLLLLSASLSVAAGSPPKNLAATITKEAQSYASALFAGDYEVVIAHTNKRIVEMMGGKEIALIKWKSGMAGAREGGYGFTEITLGTPAEPRKIGSWLTSMVPQHLVAKVPGGRIIEDSMLLGISEDSGKSWVFFDLGDFFIAKELFTKMFPELDGQIKIPEKKQKFQKD